MKPSLPLSVVVIGCLVVAGVLVIGAPITGAESAEVKPAPSVRTVFIDPGLASKQERAAAKINKVHQKMMAEGYAFVDLEVYTEDGDLKGFFATYRR